MRVSIVTISYDQAVFLERAIRSVLEQDYNDIEYIVVDPGSKDGSREIIELYRPRLDEVIFEPDEGPADGLNKGLARASGDILGFLNSDDVLLPGTISRVVDFFERHPSVDVVSGHTIIIDEHDRKIRNGYSDRFSLVRYAYRSAVLMQASTFFRSGILRSTGGLNVGNKIAWDGELFVEMARQGAVFALVNEFWSGFRIHPKSITSSLKVGGSMEASQKFHKEMFQKIMGREIQLWDYPRMVLFRFLKHARNPRGLFESLARGRI